ncbi:hypothetical protein [Brevibacillus laterosporus]|uniref:Uncharacterized protein n=1 Tax=Brevibacillus laterosporus TaxID=1465 RepID=A0AAP3DI44_BRELA|nr:hypothetical protein [Brevibacillus laterosporus]MCR8980922.1 hypothetical protein [Brevibacillus laterosporus]MCZ0808077.1 hypothetical protein [Brevibacillus laterosporus]MCZ0826269.1 hypothetical protein [Brevibacillus laterosporus]MCZ0850152.1 hypothetical protein [Brevibacillus laterosporus]
MNSEKAVLALQITYFKNYIHELEEDIKNVQYDYSKKILEGSLKDYRKGLAEVQARWEALDARDKVSWEAY